MKIEKLSNNKVRIILNIEDLEKKHIDIYSLLQNNEKTKIFLRKMLKMVQQEINFEIDNSIFFIETNILSEDFFVVTITKIEHDSTIEISNISKLKTKRKISLSNQLIATYQFDKFDEFCDFCKYFNSLSLSSIDNLAKTISLYEYKSKYFLVLYGINNNFKNTSLFSILISEFARFSSTSPCLASNLNEFGNIVFKKNAIKKVINY